MVIDSMPPATATSASPAAMPCAASITALRPEPHTLLMVSAATGVGQARLQRRLAGRGLAEARRDHVAQDALLDGARVDAGAPHGLPHDQRTELRRGERGQRALKAAGGKPDRREDDGVGHVA